MKHDRDALYEAIADRLGEHPKAYNEFDHSDEAVTCITLKAEPVEILAEFIAPAVLSHLSVVPQHDLNTEQADRVDALSAVPVEGDREALNSLYWNHPGDGHLTGLLDHQIDAILAAGFSRSSLPVEGEVTHDDLTMVKVYDSLMSVTQSGSDALDAINAMQNAGILFRERSREVVPNAE